MMRERAKIDGYDDLPTPQELRHDRAVAAVIEDLTNGEGSDLRHSNPYEWHRLEALVEDSFPHLKEGAEKLKQDRLNARAGKARSRPLLHLQGAENGNDAYGQPGPGSPSDSSPSSQGGS
jgi:hypothetical protein